MSAPTRHEDLMSVISSIRAALVPILIAALPVTPTQAQNPFTKIKKAIPKLPKIPQVTPPPGAPGAPPAGNAAPSAAGAGPTAPAGQPLNAKVQETLMGP